jgi:uncharacterized RDD family membrane protein YckC
MALDLIIVGGSLAILGTEHLFPFAFIAYKISFLAWKGSTLGYIIAGIKCVRINGDPLNWQYATARTLASILSYAACGLGFLWAAWEPRSQTWHDKLVGTIVVKIPVVG